MAERPGPHLTKYEVAAQLQVGLRTVEKLISEGQLGYVKVGRCTRIPSGALILYLERSTRHPAPEPAASPRTARASTRKTIRG